MMDLQEEACWLLLVFESGLSTRIINDILLIWCKQLGRSLHEFYEAGAQEWRGVCHLSEKIIQKIEQASEKRIGQVFLAEQLQEDHIHMITVLDAIYPKTLKLALGRSYLPPVLFFKGDLDVLRSQTVAIIGSRNASEESLAFTTSVAGYLADRGINVISGHARGVDRAAYEGARKRDGCTTVVLPHGIRKLSKVQMREMEPGIEAGKILVMSQFHPDAAWLVSRAMERNNVVTGLAQLVVVAEADTKGGTWEGANAALKQGRRLYVRSSQSEGSLTGNAQLLDRGGFPLIWPATDLAAVLAPLIEEGQAFKASQSVAPVPPNQLSLLALPYE